MKESNLEKAISSQSAQRIYDFIGKRYDWFGGYDSRAKERAHELLNLEPGMRLLEIGVGTGKQHILFQEALAPQGRAFGIDISHVMLELTKKRCSTPLCQAEARYLPFDSNTFDRLYTSYVLDLLPLAEIPILLGEFHRVLKQDGRMVIVALTEGVNTASRTLVAAWKAAYALSPVTCAGCRPLQLSTLVEAAGFEQVRREVVVQMAVPSEIVAAIK